MSTSTEFQKAWGKITAKAWEDEAFKKSLIASPDQAFKDAGSPLPDGWTSKVVEGSTADKYKLEEHPDGKTTVTLRLSPKPTGSGEMDESELESVAGGSGSACCCCSPCCTCT